MFSGRIPPDLAANDLAIVRDRMGDIPYDLTTSNPTTVGIPYPSSLLEPLGNPRGLAYHPDPRGLAGARSAVARELSLCGRPADPGSVLLTASTSEAYSLLFKLLCDPGEAVLAPAPSYPLFEYLARLDGIRLLPYRLDPRAGWEPELEVPPEPGVRALIVVNPNNPTGSYVAPAGVVAFCVRYGLALIADEVFFDFPLGNTVARASFAASRDVLTFTLGGLSKYLGLPQLKLSWTVVSGPEPLVVRALERLEFMADQYLSVATPVQLALGELFESGAGVRECIRARCVSNVEAARRAIGVGGPVELLVPAGGFSLVLRYPNVIDEDALALELLEQDRVLVHPGHFFDFADPGHLAISLLPDPAVFQTGLERVLARIHARL